MVCTSRGRFSLWASSITTRRGSAFPATASSLITASKSLVLATPRSSGAGRGLPLFPALAMRGRTQIAQSLQRPSSRCVYYIADDFCKGPRGARSRARPSRRDENSTHCGQVCELGQKSCLATTRLTENRTGPRLLVRSSFMCVTDQVLEVCAAPDQRKRWRSLEG